MLIFCSCEFWVKIFCFVSHFWQTRRRPDIRALRRHIAAARIQYCNPFKLIDDLWDRELPPALMAEHPAPNTSTLSNHNSPNKVNDSPNTAASTNNAPETDDQQSIPSKPTFSTETTQPTAKEEEPAQPTTILPRFLEKIKAEVQAGITRSLEAAENGQKPSTTPADKVDGVGSDSDEESEDKPPPPPPEKPNPVDATSQIKETGSSGALTSSDGVSAQFYAGVGGPGTVVAAGGGGRRSLNQAGHAVMGGQPGGPQPATGVLGLDGKTPLATSTVSMTVADAKGGKDKLMATAGGAVTVGPGAVGGDKKAAKPPKGKGSGKFIWLIYWFRNSYHWYMCVCLCVRTHRSTQIFPKDHLQMTFDIGCLELNGWTLIDLPRNTHGYIMWHRRF